MAMLRFFDSAKAVAFADTVVDEFAKIHQLVDTHKKHAGRKTERTVTLVQKVSVFSRNEKLSIFVRAKMLARIRDGLKERGVEPAEIAKFERAIMLESLKSRSPAGSNRS
jgi:hypothetical protein